MPSGACQESSSMLIAAPGAVPPPTIRPKKAATGLKSAGARVRIGHLLALRMSLSSPLQPLRTQPMTTHDDEKHSSHQIAEEFHRMPRFW